MSDQRIAFKYSDPKEAFAEAERRIAEAQRCIAAGKRAEQEKLNLVVVAEDLERSAKLKQQGSAEWEQIQMRLDTVQKSIKTAGHNIDEGARAQVYLALNDLGLVELPPSLVGVARLERLDLSGNRLRELPRFLAELSQLQSLNVAGNQLTTVPAFLAELQELRELSLSGNQLGELKVPLGRLTQLQVLSLEWNQLLELPPTLEEATKLLSLNLGNNQIRELPAFLGQLVQLRQLHLQNNQLRGLPATIDKLKRLELLNLDGNSLDELPVFLGELKQLKSLGLGSNTNLRIPEEITATRDPEKILGYYYLVGGRGGAQPLNEFKLILVGRGGVGKTTLVHRLVAGTYKEFKRTPGVNITRWPLSIDGEEMQAHVWDFGGQEIMHNTHRFFMTERALYLVLISSRENTEDHDAEYWLSLVRSFAGDDAPVVVLLHKWDDAHFELNRELLRKKYGRHLVFLETDSESGHGINTLAEQICALAKALPGLTAAWPRDWRRVKDDLPAAKENWLTFDAFCAFCQERGVENREDQEILAEYLHDLGLMLAYRKVEALRGFGVLNPQWVTKGIYDMLNAPELKAKNGRFTPADFAQLLPATEYPAAVHLYLLALMRKFRLCFPLDEDGRAYLIPDLLTKEEPKLDAEFPPEQCLGFIYRYESVLPEGLLPRFIVETYVHREPKHAWRTGVVLERANCRALVRGDVLGRMVTIRVIGAGNGQRELLGIIREHFERIHRSFEKLPVTELVPVPEFPNVLIPYADLLAYEAARDDEYKVAIDRPGFTPEFARIVRAFSVKKLLDGVDLPGVPRGKRVDSSLLVGSERSEGLCTFISYSHKDELFRDELRGVLTAYERKGELATWDDTRIEPGQKWEPEIIQKLESADIVLLLLSNDFIRSDYCMLKEMDLAKRRDAAGKCAIVPIVVRACPFRKLELGQLQAIIPGGKPIQQHRYRDAAWLEVTEQLDRVIARIRKGPADRP